MWARWREGKTIPEIRFWGISCPVSSSSMWICIKWPAESMPKGSKINTSTVNKLSSKHTAAFVSSLPDGQSCRITSRRSAEAWWRHSSHIFPADLNRLWLCHKFRPIPTSPLSFLPRQISTTAAEQRSGSETDGRLTGSKKKASAVAAARRDGPPCQTLRLCTWAKYSLAALLFFLIRARESCRPQHRYCTMKAGNQQLPVEMR